MPKRDYEAAPMTKELGLAGVITGLVSDLEDLRAGKISTGDAQARAALAKQVFNGVRLYLNATVMLSDAAKPTAALSPGGDQ